MLHSMARSATLAIVLPILAMACQVERQPPMRIGTLLWPGTELLYLAQHNGDLPPGDFRLVEFVDDGEAMRAFRNGTVEAAMLTLDEVLTLADAGANPVILFVADESRGGDAIVAQPGITTVAGLKGRRVAAQVQSVGAYLLAQALLQAGLKATDIQLVNLPPYRQMEPFVARSIDAMATHEPFVSQAPAGTVTVFDSSAAGDRPLTVLAVRGEHLTNDVARATVLCSAWFGAVQTIRTSAAARAWTAGRTRTPVPEFERMLTRLELKDRDHNRRYLSGSTPALLTSAARTRSVKRSAGLATGDSPLRNLLARPDGLGGDCTP